jgi:hypothetical protein
MRQRGAEQKNCLFILGEFFGGARKSEIVKAIFLLGSVLNEQAVGLRFRLGRGGIPPTPPSAAPSLGLANFSADKKLQAESFRERNKLG